MSPDISNLFQYELYDMICGNTKYASKYTSKWNLFSAYKIVQL